MIADKYSSSAAQISTPRLSPASDLIIQARDLERQASLKAGEARRAATVPHLAAHSVRLTDQARELLDQAAALRREVRRMAPPAGWFHAEFFGSRLTVTNVDSRRSYYNQVKVRMVVFVEGDPADFDDAEMERAIRELVASINADPDSVEWTHAEDLTLDSFLASELPDGFCVSVAATGDRPGIYQQ